ncbi:MAG: nicotinate-nucleotide adenylyltransferase [Actinomycetota bacterium]
MRAILGGTFDPPHIAHLVAGEVAHEQLGLETVTFVPAGRPWQKVGRGVSEARHRLRMVEIATAGTNHFAVDDREVHRDGWTFTIDTVESCGDQDVVLILGADSARNLPTWQRADELLERATVAVVPRPSVDRSDVERAIGEALVWLDMPALDVSGTMLRERMAAGKSIRFLVPDAVLDYMNEHNLYKNPS